MFKKKSLTRLNLPFSASSLCFDVIEKTSLTIRKKIWDHCQKKKSLTIVKKVTGTKQPHSVFCVMMINTVIVIIFVGEQVRVLQFKIFTDSKDRRFSTYPLRKRHVRGYFSSRFKVTAKIANINTPRPFVQL